MTPSELLQKFMQEKDAIIFKVTGQHLYDPEDYEDAKNFSDEVLEEFFRFIDTDEVTCIWCTVYFGENCNICGYGERHGNCCETGSHYDSLCRSTDGRVIRFHRLSDMAKLIAKTKEEFSMPNLIVEFLKEQNRLLGLELYNEEDLAEAATFNERKFFKQLKMADNSLNPWCSHTAHCGSCNYGKRHDICGLVGSTYSEARGYDFAPYLYERPGMVEICVIFKLKSWWRSLWNSN